MIVRGRELSGPLRLQADAVVVGMGAGGSVALRELARAGLRVIGFEEGAHTTSRDFTQREEEMIPLLFQDGGGRMTEDLAIRILQGRGLGGSTVHNTNLCKRIPTPILDRWKQEFGVAGLERLDASFEQIERELSVTEIPEELENANNQVLRRGVEKLGYRGGPLRHNRVGCQLSGFCELGCAYDAKENATKVILPQAEKFGADIYADAKVDRVAVEGERVDGIKGRFTLADGKSCASFRVDAPVVVLAGSAIGTPALALRSGLTDPHRQCGRHLRMHPGAVVAGRFDEELSSYRGIPQSFECTEFLSFEPRDNQRVWIVPAFAHPIATAALLPGFGKEHMRGMRTYAHLAALTAMVHDDAEGEVRIGEDGRVAVSYRMSPSDQAQLADGLLAGARILFAAGAKEVVVPAVPPIRLRSPREIDAVDRRILGPHSVPLTAVHPMGTMRMGRDPKESVVDSHGEHHFTRGLFVADGSLFPTSIGGPPQIGIYALSLHLATRYVARARELRRP